MLKYLEKLYFLNFCIPYTYFKFILAKLKQKNLYVRFTKKYQQTLVKPIFIKLGCQIVTRITIRNYQTSVSISIDIFIYTLQLCDNLLTPSLKLWDKTQYLARVWNLEKQDAVCFCLLWVYQSPSLEQSALKSSLGWCPGDFSMSWNQSETICRVRLQMSRSLPLLSEAELIWILQQKKVPGKQFKCKLRIWKLIPFNANYAQQPLKSLGTFSCTAASDAFSSLLSHPKFPFHDSGFSNRPPGHYCSAHLDFSL